MRKPLPFGKYLLLDRIAVGGMAEVFAAKTFGVEGFERLVAIKRILPTMVEDDEFITMFIDEARIAALLSHANLVHIYELGKHEEAYFMAMEYVPGRDVRLIIDKFKKKGQTVPVAMAVYILARMCEGLDYAHRKRDAQGHEQNIIHRDISPQNVLVSYEGGVKIIDFGIAKAAGRLQKTQAGILKGKFGYMSPEQVRGLAIDHRSDIYSCGVMMYEMLTGTKLFSGESDFSTLEKVRAGEVRAPSEINPAIPPGLERIALKALAKERDDRYQWCSELHDDLMRFLYSGEDVYSAKSLSTFMKDAFAIEYAKEQERQRRWEATKPEEVIDFDLSATNPPVPVPQAIAAAPETAAPEPVADGGKVRIGPPSAFMTSELRLQERTSLFQPFVSEERPPPPAEPSELVTDAASLASIGLADDEVEVQHAPTHVRSADLPFNLDSRRHSGVSRRPKENDDGGSGVDAEATGDQATRVRPPPMPVSERSKPAPVRARRSSAARKVTVALLVVVLVAVGLGGAWKLSPRARGFATGAWRKLTGPAAGHLYIEVTPSRGAIVRVDGRRVADALPLSLTPAAGTHHVAVQEDRFQPFTQDVQIRPKSSVTLKVELKRLTRPAAPPPSPVTTAASPSTPANPAPKTPPAVASDQGHPPTVASKSPPEVPRREPSSRERRRGHRPGRESSIGAEARRKPGPTAAVDPPGTLVVFSIPRAALSVDDQPRGTTPQRLPDLPGNRPVRLSLSAPGYETMSKQVEAPSGSSKMVRFRLVPVATTRPAAAPPATSKPARAYHGTGKLIAMCIPTAQVVVDGEPTGRWTPVPMGNPIAVPAGPHTVYCQSKSGARSPSQKLLVSGGATVKFMAHVPAS